MGFIKSLECPYNGILNGEEVILQEIIHAVHFRINENGAEGAAASIVYNGISTGEDPSIINVDFNRPFIYLIEEVTTGAILFIGEVNTL